MSDFLKRLGAFLNGDTIIRLADLPEDLREPLKGFVRSDAQFLTAREMHEIYAKAAQLLKAREWVYEREAATAQAATALQLARAKAAFIATLTPEGLALLEMQMTVRARYELERLERHNFELESQLAHYKAIAFVPSRDED